MRPSSEVVRALAALGIAAGTYVALLAGFTAFASHAERSWDAHPYDPGEEMFRFMLPSFVGQPGERRIMLTGASTAQELFLYERFEKAFPGYDAYQASFSGATVDDVLVALDYVERVYGEEALPAVLVVGFETRALANLPRTFGSAKSDDPEQAYSYILTAIDRYSPYFRTEGTERGSVLVPKTRSEGWRSWWSFVTRKQQPRYRAAVAAALNRLLNGPGAHLALTSDLPEFGNIRRPWSPPASLRNLLRWLASERMEAVRSFLAAYTGPYVHQYRPVAGYDMDPGGEEGIHYWDPDAEADLVVGQLRRLHEMAEAHDIQLFVVAVPEHPTSRREHPAASYQALLALTLEGLGDTPFIDLRSTFGEEAFIDDAHVRRPAAERATAEVIRAIEARGGIEG